MLAMQKVSIFNIFIFVNLILIFTNTPQIYGNEPDPCERFLSKETAQEDFKNLIASNIAKLYPMTPDEEWVILPFSGIRIPFASLQDFMQHHSAEEMVGALSDLAEMTILIVESSAKDASHIVPAEDMVVISLGDPHYHFYIDNYFTRDAQGKVQGKYCYHEPKTIEDQIAFQLDPKNVHLRTRHIIALMSDTSMETIFHEYLHFLQHLSKIYPEVHAYPHGDIDLSHEEIEAEVHLFMAYLGVLLPHLKMGPYDIIQNIRSAADYLRKSKAPQSNQVAQQLFDFENFLKHHFKDIIIEDSSWNRALESLREDPHSPLVESLEEKLFSDEPQHILEALEVLEGFSEDERVVAVTSQFVGGYYGTEIRRKAIQIMAKALTPRSFEILKKYYHEEFELKAAYREAFQQMIQALEGSHKNLPLLESLRTFLSKIKPS